MGMWNAKGPLENSLTGSLKVRGTPHLSTNRFISSQIFTQEKWQNICIQIQYTTFHRSFICNSHKLGRPHRSTNIGILLRSKKERTIDTHESKYKFKSTFTDRNQTPTPQENPCITVLFKLLQENKLISSGRKCIRVWLRNGGVQSARSQGATGMNEDEQGPFGSDGHVHSSVLLFSDECTYVKTYRIIHFNYLQALYVDFRSIKH